jgi:hypothetical protein
MKHLLIGVYHFCLNKSTGVKIGPAMRIIDFPYMYIVKTWKIFRLKKKKTKELELEFSSSECLPSLLKWKPWGQKWPAKREGQCFSIYVYSKNFKNFLELELRYLSWNIFKWVSTMFVQIKALGWNLPRPWCLYTGEWFQGHHPLVYSYSPLFIWHFELCQGHNSKCKRDINFKFCR